MSSLRGGSFENKILKLCNVPDDVKDIQSIDVDGYYYLPMLGSFKQNCQRFVASARKQKACLKYNLYIDLAEPKLLIFKSTFESIEGLRRHIMASEHTKHGQWINELSRYPVTVSITCP